MATDENRELAERVVDLTVMNRTQDDFPGNFREKMREDQIRLHLKHFEPEQMKALIDFYETDMGKSISDSQKRMADDFRSGFKLERH